MLEGDLLLGLRNVYRACVEYSQLLFTLDFAGDAIARIYKYILVSFYKPFIFAYVEIIICTSIKRMKSKEEVHRFHYASECSSR